MGYKVGIEIAESNLSLEQKLEWHLTGNHVPAIDTAFIPCAIEAIELANTNNWDSVITLPNGLERTVAFVVEGLHLEPFVSTVTTPEED